MRWNEMTGVEFKNAVHESEGVCLFSIGCLEPHGNHLPLGMDYMEAWHFTDLAAEKEKAIVFPPYYFGSVTAAAKWPGCIALPSQLLLEILTATFKEISRNGVKKIIIVNAHGGNTSFLNEFLRMHNDEERDYMIYLCPLSVLIGPRAREVNQKVKERRHDFGGHASSSETAVALHLFPECVKMNECLPPEAGKRKNKLVGLNNMVQTPTDWYGSHEHHLDGYGGEATEADGAEICEAISEDLAEIIRRVKADDLTMEIYQDFLEKAGRK